MSSNVDSYERVTDLKGREHVVVEANDDGITSVCIDNGKVYAMTKADWKDFTNDGR